MSIKMIVLGVGLILIGAILIGAGIVILINYISKL